MRSISTLYMMAIVLCGSVAIGGVASASSVTGDPAADGWVEQGHSLQSGVYVTGSANYGYRTYGAGFTIQAGSNLQLTDGNDANLSWLAGDTVVGVGGAFESITDGDAGWTIGGGGINSLLGSSGPKLQAKFGTADATWSTSTNAPTNGNGNSSSSNGGGRVQVRTSGFFQPGTPLAGQTEPWTWDGHSGQVLVLDKDDHISWAGDSNLAKEVARMIWIWDGNAQHVASWQLLLNVSLLERVAPEDYTGLYPAIGDAAIMTVQNGDSTFTDALVTTQNLPNVVPLPAAVWAGMVMLGGMGGVRAWKRRRAAA